MSERESSSDGEPIWLIALPGLALIVAAVVALFVVDGHDAVGSTALTVGAALLFGGVLLPNMAGEFEIGTSGVKGQLRALRRRTQAAESAAADQSKPPALIPQTSTIPPAPADLVPAPLPDLEEPRDVSERIEDVLTQASLSPVAALLHVAADVEDELRAVLAQTGSRGTARMALGRLTTLANDGPYVPADLIASLRMFASLRNEIVHGPRKTSTGAVLSAVDSGVAILRILSSLPRERHYVLRANIPIWGDPERTSSAQGFTGLLLLSRQSSFVQHQRVFLTRRNDYVDGQSIGYAFEMNSVLTGYLEDGTRVETLEFDADIVGG